MHAEDQDQLFQFSLTGFQLIDTHESIVFINTRSNGAKYETISKQNLVKYEKVFYDDFFAFTELRSGSPVTRPGGEPVPTVSVPYIPLEPWWEVALYMISLAGEILLFVIQIMK